MSFGPISVLSPRFNSSEYLSMRVEDPDNMRGGLNLGPALTLNQNPIFEMASTNSIHFHPFKKSSHSTP